MVFEQTKTFKDAQTQWMDPFVEDQTYSKLFIIICNMPITPAPEISLSIAEVTLKGDKDCLLYTGIPLLVFQHSSLRSYCPPVINNASSRPSFIDTNEAQTELCLAHALTDEASDRFCFPSLGSDVAGQETVCSSAATRLVAASQAPPPPSTPVPHATAPTERTSRRPLPGQSRRRKA